MNNILNSRKTIKIIHIVLLIMGLITANQGFPTNTGNDGELDEEIGLSPQQIAKWLISQLKNDFINQPSDIPIVPFQLGKRNSAELTSSIMAIPRTIIDNGRK